MATFNDGPEARAKLAETVRQAMHEQGFFTLINHGISKEEVDRQLDIAWTIFSKTPLEEKKRLKGKMQETGSYKGFKLRSYYEYVISARHSWEQLPVIPCTAFLY
jgi:isopenicillin N synthase-like dioxygenase